MTTLDDLEAARRDAAVFIPSRRDHATLYTLLGRCMVLCERVLREGLLDTVATAVKEKASDKSRAYFERNPDVYLVVARYVFEGEKRRDACWRYTATMREAAKRQIKGADLAVWLAENGGVAALFLERPTKPRSSFVKSLHLTERIAVTTGEPFTVQLVRRPDGKFDVVRAEP
jgi:hypothetical protein